MGWDGGSINQWTDGYIIDGRMAKDGEDEWMDEQMNRHMEIRWIYKCHNQQDRRKTSSFLTL